VYQKQGLEKRLEELDPTCKNLTGQPLDDPMPVDLYIKFVAPPEVPPYQSQ